MLFLSLMTSPRPSIWKWIFFLFERIFQFSSFSSLLIIKWLLPDAENKLIAFNFRQALNNQWDFIYSKTHYNHLHFVFRSLEVSSLFSNIQYYGKLWRLFGVYWKFTHCYGSMVKRNNLRCFRVYFLTITIFDKYKSWFAWLQLKYHYKNKYYISLWHRIIIVLMIQI